MSELNRLINELCPNGVRYSSIGSIISRVREKGKDNPSISQVYVVSNTQGMVRAEDYRENTIHSEDTSMGVTFVLKVAALILPTVA